MTTQAPVELSILGPLYNERENIPLLYTRLGEAVSALGRTWEIIFIDDGSSDGTRGLIEALAESQGKRAYVIAPKRENRAAAPEQVPACLA